MRLFATAETHTHSRIASPAIGAAGEIGASLIVAITTKYDDFYVNFAQSGHFYSFRANFWQF
jgi:hypothetical protein